MALAHIEKIQLQLGHGPNKPCNVHDGMVAPGRTEIGRPQVAAGLPEVECVGQIDMDACAAVTKNLADFFKHLLRSGMRIVIVFEMSTRPEVLTGNVADDLAVKSNRRAPTMGSARVTHLLGEQVAVGC